MRHKRTLFRVPFALCAIGVWAFIFGGCGKQEPASAPTGKGAVTSAVDEAAYQRTLSADRVRYGSLVQERNKIVDKLRAMVEAKKAELKTDDLEKVKAVLDRDPVWRALQAACTNANEQVKRQRREAQKDVRQHMQQKTDVKPISK